MIFIHRSKNQRIAMIVVSGLLIVGLGLWIFIATKNNQTNEGAIENSLTTASSLTTEGKYDQALQTLKESEKQAKTNEEKLRILNDLAAAAANAGQLEEALNYYDQKHQLDPASTKADGYLVGELYERLGQNQKAIESFQAFLDYLKSLPADDYTNQTIPSMTDRIKTMQGSQ